MTHLVKNNNKILLFIPKGVELIELSAFTDVFGWAREHGKLNIEVCTGGFTKNVCTAFGNTFTVDYVFESISDLQLLNNEDYIALAIPGGFENSGFFEDAYDERLMGLVQLFNTKKKPIATICTAAFILAKAGVLIGKNATTYNKLNGRKQRQLSSMGVNIIDEPIVCDDNLITSYGPASAPYVAFELLSMITSKEFSDRVKDMMCF